MNTSFVSLGAATKSQVFICSMKLHASSWSRESILKILVGLFIFLIVLTMSFRVNSKPAHRGNIIPDIFLFFSLLGQTLKNQFPPKNIKTRNKTRVSPSNSIKATLSWSLYFSPVVFFFLFLILAFSLLKLLRLLETNCLCVSSCSVRGEPQPHQTHFHVSFISRTL